MMYRCLWCKKIEDGKYIAIIKRGKKSLSAVVFSGLNSLWTFNKYQEDTVDIIDCLDIIDRYNSKELDMGVLEFVNDYLNGYSYQESIRRYKLRNRYGKVKADRTRIGELWGNE